jgi:hypothetical protein
VVVVELLPEIARDMEAVTRGMTLKRLAGVPVEILTRTTLVRMEGHEAFVVGPDDESERSLGRFDSVIVAVGHASYDPLSDRLRARGLPVAVIGDASRPGQILDATQAGRRAVEDLSRDTAETSAAAESVNP